MPQDRRKITYITMLSLTGLIISLSTASQMVCYFTNWSQYRPGAGKYMPQNVDPFLCTHLIYAFSIINNKNELVTYEWNDETLYKTFNGLKSKNPGLKTLLAVGGWNFGFPSWCPLRTRDLQHVYCLDETKYIMRNVSKTTGKSQLMLTAAVSAGKGTIDAGYEIAQIAKYLDFINVMTYDFHGTWERVTGHNSPLYRGSQDFGDLIYFNTDYAMKYWRDQGTPVEKLRMGFAAYGRTFRLASSNTGVGAPASGAASAGPFTREAGFWSYYEICNFLQGANVQWIDDQKVPYASKNNEWVGFDNQKSYEIKVQYMKNMKFGGAFVWALDLDDFRGEFCGQGAHPLLAHLRKLVAGIPVIPTTSKPATSTAAPTTMTTHKPSSTTAAPSTKTTIPIPGRGFCKDKPDGTYANPNDKTSFYVCAGGRTYLRKCGVGTVFDDSCKCCIWP
uniref:chitinase n=1 Tax=Hippocampus comes TaxID=109280 RepID=A0A3Q3DFC2_HIPCM